MSADIRGDGREAIVAGYYALDGDGRYLWKVRNFDHVFNGEHADVTVVDVFEPGGRPKAVAACGMGGVLYVDAATGDTLQQIRGLGHTQEVDLGWLRRRGIAKPTASVEQVEADAAKKIRVKIFRHTDCVEVGHDRYEEVVGAFLNKVGEADTISINALTYTHVDIGSQKILTDYAIQIIYRG